MVGQFCTSDVENYGDLLYPIILPKVLKQYGDFSDILALGFMRGPAPCKAGYEVYDINDVLIRNKIELSKLFIGGGDILRTDKLSLSSHYKNRFDEVFNSKFFTKSLRKLLKISNVDKFSKRFMGYESPGPFILSNKDYNKISKIFYCSCGVPFEFDAIEKNSVRDAFETASFIYLRDNKSKDKLLNIGVEKKIHVAPDLIVKISDYFDLEKEKHNGKRLLNLKNVDTNKQILCFQANPQSKKSTDTIIRELMNYKRNTKSEIILLPIGYCHKDHEYLKTLSFLSGGEFIYIDVYSVFDMLSVIAASNFFLGTSMHGNITAFSFNIPHLFGKINVDKIDGFLEVVGLPSSFKLDHWSEINDKISLVKKMGENDLRNIVNAAKLQVGEVFQSLCCS